LFDKQKYQTRKKAVRLFCRKPICLSAVECFAINYALYESTLWAYRLFTGGHLTGGYSPGTIQFCQCRIVRCVSKKFSPLNSVTLSNLNRFSKFLHCWKTYEICYKTHMTIPSSP